MKYHISYVHRISHIIDDILQKRQCVTRLSFRQKKTVPPSDSPPGASPPPSSSDSAERSAAQHGAGAWKRSPSAWPQVRWRSKAGKSPRNGHPKSRNFPVETSQSMIERRPQECFALQRSMHCRPKN